MTALANRVQLQPGLSNVCQQCQLVRADVRTTVLTCQIIVLSETDFEMTDCDSGKQT